VPTAKPKPSHPDDQLPAPLRWATRLFSSLWVLGGLTVLVVGYVAAALVPVGGRYLWQAPWIDATQVGVLKWTPFHVALLLLVCVLVWTTLRRVAWRWRNLGVFVLVVGVALALVGLSTGWRYQVRGLLAVNEADDPGVLQTRYLDPTQRVLFVQIGSNPPQQVPLDGLPRWHDSGADALLIPLHQHPGLRSQLEFRAQVHAVAYIADGALDAEGNEPGVGVLSPRPTPQADRDWPLRNSPARSLLALRFTANSSDGPEGETTVWLSFDLAAGQRVMPQQSYEVPGLGPVRLAFTLANKDLGFAVGAQEEVRAQVSMSIADTDPTTRQVIPPVTYDLIGGQSVIYKPVAPEPTLRNVTLTAGTRHDAKPPEWITVSSTPALLPVYLGSAITALGLLLTLVFKLLLNKRPTDAPA